MLALERRCYSRGRKQRRGGWAGGGIFLRRGDEVLQVVAQPRMLGTQPGVIALADLVLERASELVEEPLQLPPSPVRPRIGGGDVLGDEAVEADGLGKLGHFVFIQLDGPGGMEQAQAVKLAPHGGPAVIFIQPGGGDLRVARAGHGLQPRERDGIRHEQAGELQRAARGRAEPGERPADERADAVLALPLRLVRGLAVADLPVHVGFVREAIHPGEALAPEVGEKGAGQVALLRAIAEVGGDELHSERVAAEGADDLQRSGVLGLAREGVGLLKITQQVQGIGLGQDVDFHALEGAVAAAEVVGIEPGGDDELQPFLGEQLRDLAGGEQGEVVHIIQHEEGARMLDGRERLRGRMPPGMRRELLLQEGDAGEGGALQVGEHGLRGEAEVRALGVGEHKGLGEEGGGGGFGGLGALIDRGDGAGGGVVEQGEVLEIL